MKQFTTASGFRSLYWNRSLLHSLVIRDIQARYRGTILGFMWAVIYPLMMLALYAFVFGGVFNSRWGNGGGIQDFVLMLYCGLIVHGLFSETLNRSPTAVLSNPSYVKKVVFPLELLPITQLVSAIFNSLIGICLLTGFVFFQHHSIPVTVFFVPLVLLPLVIFTAGLAWFLAAIGVFFRDISQMLNVIMSILMFFSPVFYPMSSVPPFARDIMLLNPLTYPMEALRGVLILGNQPNWLHWTAYSLASVLVAVAGLWVFQRSRPAFADVI